MFSSTYKIWEISLQPLWTPLTDGSEGDGCLWWSCWANYQFRNFFIHLTWLCVVWVLLVFCRPHPFTGNWGSVLLGTPRKKAALWYLLGSLPQLSGKTGRGLTLWAPAFFSSKPGLQDKFCHLLGMISFGKQTRAMWKSYKYIADVKLWHSIF